MKNILSCFLIKVCVTCAASFLFQCVKTLRSKRESSSADVHTVGSCTFQGRHNKVRLLLNELGKLIYYNGVFKCNYHWIMFWNIKDSKLACLYQTVKFYPTDRKLAFCEFLKIVSWKHSCTVSVIQRYNDDRRWYRFIYTQTCIFQ